MVIAENCCFVLESPKLLRCNLDPCNIYQLVLQHKFTKEIFLFKVRDLSWNTLRFYFNMQVPDCFPDGEYDYFIISNDEWSTDEINVDIVKHTNLYTDKGLVTLNDKCIIIGDKLLVTKFFKARVFNCGKQLTYNGDYVIAQQASQDDKAYGDIVKNINILGRGLLKFNYCREDKDDVTYYEGSKIYKEYNG